MKLSAIVFLAVLTVSAAGHADVGNGALLSCQGQEASLKIAQTAVSGFFQGQLTADQTTYSLTCKPVKSSPGNITHLMSCSENRAGEGKLLVDIQTGGFAGNVISAYVSQEQIYPVAPAQIATLICKKAAN